MNWTGHASQPAFSFQQLHCGLLSRGTREILFSAPGNISSRVPFATAIDWLHRLNGNQRSWLPFRVTWLWLPVASRSLRRDPLLLLSLSDCASWRQLLGCDSVIHESKSIESLMDSLQFSWSSVANWIVRQTDRQNEENISTISLMARIRSLLLFFFLLC